MMSQIDLLKRWHARNDFSVSPAVSALAYADSLVVGGLITIDNSTTQNGPHVEGGLSCILQSMLVMDLSQQSPALDFYFFNQQPSSFNDQAAFAPSNADWANFIGRVVVAAADYKTGGGASVANSSNQRNLGQVLKPANGTGLYCYAVARAAFTLTKPTIQFRFQFSQGL